MRKEKIVIGIDASSKAIGLGIIKSGEMTFPGSSQCFYPTKQNDDSILRGNDLFNNFASKFTELSAKILDKISKDDVAIVINAGYKPGLGAEDPIKFVEHRIMGLIMDLGLNKPIIIYDSQWMHNISSDGDIKRDVKKLKTIEYVFSKGLGMKIEGLYKKTPSTVGGKDNIYSFKIGISHYTITDDEADALMAAWAYSHEMLSDKQIATANAKKKIAKQETQATLKRKLKEKILKFENHIEIIKSEIVKYNNLYSSSGNKRDLNVVNSRKVALKTFEDDLVVLKKELETFK